MEEPDHNVDRTTRTVSSVVNIGGEWIQRRTTTLLPEGAAPDHQVDHSLDGRRSTNIAFGLVTSTVRGSLDQNNTRTTTTTAPDRSYSISTSVMGRLTSVARYDSNNQAMGSTTFEYDGHGRQWKVTDARNGATWYGFNNADEVIGVTNPPPTGSGPGPVTVSQLDAMGRATNVIMPDSKNVRTEFLSNGLRQKTWGARTYPVQFGYDPQGRMTNMVTWQDYAGGAGAATTSCKGVKL